MPLEEPPQSHGPPKRRYGWSPTGKLTAGLTRPIGDPSDRSGCRAAGGLLSEALLRHGPRAACRRAWAAVLGVCWVLTTRESPRPSNVYRIYYIHLPHPNDPNVGNPSSPKDCLQVVATTTGPLNQRLDASQEVDGNWRETNWGRFTYQGVVS